MAPSGSAAPPVVGVFGLEDRAVRWLVLALRDAGVVAVHLPADLSPGAAHSVVSALDAGIHTMSARRGMDATYLEYWQLLGEAGTPRYVAVHDLGPVTLDVNEAAAIAARVLEEDVHPISMPLLDDDETVIGVLDVVTGEQWLPDRVDPPRTDFVDAVEAERNVLLEEAGGEVLPAVLAGELAVAATVSMTPSAGVSWLAAHLPDPTPPPAAVVLPGDDARLPFVRAGGEGLRAHAVLAVHGTDVVDVSVESLAAVLDPALRDQVPPGEVAAMRASPVPPVGATLMARS